MQEQSLKVDMNATNNNFIQQIINSSNMLSRSGRGESRRNPFQGNQMVLDSLPFPNTSQFPPQRLEPTFQARSSHNAFGNGQALPETLNLLCDIAVGGKGSKSKRTKQDDLYQYQSSDRKRQKTTLKSTPVLLERLSAMKGGFRWAGASKWATKPSEEIVKEQKEQQRQKELEKALAMGGGFPMPRVKEDEPINVAPSSLYSFQVLWQQTRPDMRQEVLSRAVERGWVELREHELAYSFVQNTL